MKTWFFPLLLLGFGLLGILTLRSVAPGLAAQQLLFVCLGLATFWLVNRFSFYEYLHWRWLLYVGLVILLCIPLIIGKTTRGIAAWIDIGTFFSIQPSQLAIPVVTLVLSQYLGWFKASLRSAITMLIIIGLPGVLILVEPDLGTFIVYMASLGSMIFVSRVPWQWLLTIGVAGLFVIISGWFWWLAPYQKARLTSFIDLSSNSSANYNAQQALIAVGSGSLIGRGLGQGVQSHLRFLPERQTDFIFASLSEELGFLGAATVLFGYGASVVMISKILHHTTYAPARFYLVSILTMLVIQTTINIGMNMGLVPITGITLPLISYGGSSWLAIAGMLGIVQVIWTHHYFTKQSHFT